MTASHAMTINGRVSMELWPQPGLSLEEELTVRLQRLDGESVFAYLLWRLPEGHLTAMTSARGRRSTYSALGEWPGALRARFESRSTEAFANSSSAEGTTPARGQLRTSSGGTGTRRLCRRTRC